MMKTHHATPTQRPIRILPSRAVRAFAAPLVLASLWLVSGCEQPREIPPMTVETVTAYGKTLDADATPEQVAFVLLRSLRDDVEAAQAQDRDAQREAFKTTFALAAYSTINRRAIEAQPVPSNAPENGGLRRERIHEVVNHWAPIVAYYVQSIEKDFESATERMRVAVGGPDDATAVVLYPVQHDPDQAEPGEPVLLEIELVQEPATQGEQRYWRVARVAFRGPMPTYIGPADSGEPADDAP